MRLLLLAVFITLPSFSFAQGQEKFTILIDDTLELPTDQIPDSLDLPKRLDKFKIKKDKKENTKAAFVVQVGEEEHTFQPNGEYQEINFTHDIKGQVVYILDDNRTTRGKPFKLKPRKKPKK